MRASELTTGRVAGVTFDHGDDFYSCLAEACRSLGIRQGYIPVFIAGFSEARIVGACDKLDDPGAPVWSAVHVTNIEALGGGTLAYDPDTGLVSPHIHVTVGRKEQSADGLTSHLLSAAVQFLTEMVIVEVLAPEMVRKRAPHLHDVPLLQFGTAGGQLPAARPTPHTRARPALVPGDHRRRPPDMRPAKRHVRRWHLAAHPVRANRGDLYTQVSGDI